MITIEYRVVYTDATEEIVRVLARDINSGFPKALRLAREPLGNGMRREIFRIEFSQVP